MVTTKHSSMKYLILLIIIGVCLLSIVECRGGRGGGSRGGSRFGSRSRTSSSSSGSTSRVRSYRGPSYSKGSWKTAAAAGVVFGLMAYQTRSMYRRYPNREPAICFNEKNLKNGTYGYFVCPQRYDPDDLAKCCGPDDAEYCCKGTLTGGAIAGIVIGFLVIIFIVTGVIVVFKNRAKRRNKSGHVVNEPPKTENDPLNPGAVYQPSNTDAPVSWNTAPDGSMPYAPSPGGYGYQPAPGGNGFQPGPTAGYEGYPPGNPEAYPPQPYPPQPYPPQSYPPQQYGVQQPDNMPMRFDAPNKGPIPEGNVSGGLPYTSTPGMGYPPQGQPNGPPPAYPGTQPY